MIRKDTVYEKELVESLNKDIEEFPQVHKITGDMSISHSDISRLVMLDRYSFKDTKKKTLKNGDLVVVTIVIDTKFPVRGIGKIIEVFSNEATIKLDENYLEALINEDEKKSGIITRPFELIDKPLELYYEQISKRNAFGLSRIEDSLEQKEFWFNKFYELLSSASFIPAGRVLYGAGSETDVTYFSCFVMPFPKDSRGGIAEHRKEVTEIMSRGGGVGTNGSTLRPRGAITKGVNGKASGAVSWLDDLAKLTHLVEQGGSRRGAQMIMLADWHPDIFEFVLAKIQNPFILKYLVKEGFNEEIRQLANKKLKFTAFTESEKELYKFVSEVTPEFFNKKPELSEKYINIFNEAENKLKDGGVFSVNDPEFLSGANISVCFTKDFMEAVEKDTTYDLRFPDVENYNQEEMEIYDREWHTIGDVREWEKLGHRVKVYKTIRAKDLWNLVNLCATYSAEPGVFFLDTANKMTNSLAYGQKGIGTNPCGEQFLTPYSTCNLASINLAEMFNKEGKTVDFEKLKETVKIGVRLQDNVLDATPYFLEANRKQALGERRIGMGCMGLHDLLIYCEKRYGSKEGNELISEIFKTISYTAYRTSIELAKERGSFPFLVGKTAEETKNLREAFINTGFMKNMPEDIREGVLQNGIRNSHLITVAPTGSSGVMFKVSTGLEPYFSFSYFRSGRLGKFIEVHADIVNEYLENNPGVSENNLPDFFVSAMELTPEEHVDTQCIIQKYVDSSISKTVNAPKGYSVGQVKNVYERLYKGGAKGGTVYVDGSRDSQVLTLTNENNEDFNKRLDLSMVVDFKAESDDTVYGVEEGNVCPLCRVGVVKKLGGCNTCIVCKAQLKCGL